MINRLLIKGNLEAERGKGNRTTVYTGTWSSNFQSWKSFKHQDRYLLIKYEDLINEPENTFLKILNFVYELNKSKFILDQKKFKNVIKTTSFDYMKNLEKEKGFNEATKDKDGKAIPFFNLGKKNDWKILLDNKIKTKLEKAFEKEMIELEYL